MKGVWHFIHHWYLKIPYSPAEAHLFRHVWHTIPFWMPGFIALSIVPAGYILMILLSVLFSGFEWVRYEKALEVIKERGRKYSYYGLWLAYIIWAPMPWPRAATFGWTVVGWFTMRHFWKKRRRRIVWMSTLDKADLALVPGWAEWLERQQRIEVVLDRTLPWRRAKAKANKAS
ncbi:hypothetical protein C7445_1345 [Alicyclobacillus sacchari]|uniref:Uncharacterized protein n=2 Tax=Alicyclobacillus sacchari TaxID=392010 RepID=A0A4R8L6R8_9BACL|nr:hypothetical protein [Alicyclobacillus sacchari]TDY38333.1 hypothetical protein C7445_1345 [Alicyclobacillus sacchari]